MYICNRSCKEKLPQPNNWLKQAKIKQEPPALDNSPLKSISPLSPAASASISSACEAEGADSQQLSTTLPVWLHQVTPRRPVFPDGHFSVSACFPHSSWSGMGAIPLTARWAPTANQHRNIKAGPHMHAVHSARGAKSCAWVFMGVGLSVFSQGGYQQLIPMPGLFCAITAEGCSILIRILILALDC